MYVLESLAASALVFGHASTPIQLQSGFATQSPQSVDKITFRQPHRTDNKRLMLDIISDLGRRGPLARFGSKT